MMCYVRQASAERKRAKQQWDDLTPRANRHLLMTQNASDPLREVAPDGGLVYILIMYDGTFITDPALVTAVLGTYDPSCTRPDAEGTSNATNTVAMLYASDDQINNAGGFWTHSGAELTSTHPCNWENTRLPIGGAHIVRMIWHTHIESYGRHARTTQHS